MKYPIILFLSQLLTLSVSQGQTWQSISKTGTFETTPFSSFKINTYTNDIWFIDDTKVSVIENNGVISIFTSAELGTLWDNDNLQFAFTPTNTYFNIALFGFHSFTGFSSNLLEPSFENYLNITSDHDTLYITMKDLGGFKKYYNGITESYTKNFTEIDAKNAFIYGNNGGSGIYHYTLSSDSFVPLMLDPQYLYCLYNDTKFSRNTDTFYVASVQGISYAYNYDFLDTITPNNTTNMPSANVLEIEFDHLDSLWAVFGDVNDVPFAIAKLEGSTWNTIYNVTNSPIDFSNFLGLEIDTMGNLWVADNQSLHTLLTPNSPTWLNVNSIDSEQAISIYPNPTAQQITLSSSEIIDCIEVLDVYGCTILTISEIKATEYNLDFSAYSNGKYILKVISDVKTEFHSIVKN